MEAIWPHVPYSLSPIDMEHTNWNDELLQAGKGDQKAQNQTAFNNPLPRVVAAVVGACYKLEEDAGSFAVTIVTCDTNQIYDRDDDKNNLVGPGKGNSKSERKAKYRRTKGRGYSFYVDNVNHFNTHKFK